jgi:Flp pilus assembly protein TadD
MAARSKRVKRSRGPAGAPAPVSAAAPRFTGLAACALLAIAVFLLYAGSYRYPLVFDDKLINLIDLPDMTSSCASLKRRCVASTTLGLSYLAAGFDLFWFRAGNVLCHAAAAVACFLFLDRLFEAALARGPGEDAAMTAGNRRATALCGAVWFAAHPVAVYGVAYLSQRTILMATLFSLLSLFAFVRALSAQSRGALWLSVLLYALALASKEHAIMLPAVALAIAVLLRRPIPGSWLEWLALISVLAGAAVFIMLRVDFVIGAAYEAYAREVDGLQAGGGAPIDPVNAYLASLATQAWLFFKYLFLWLIPYPGWMSIDLRQPIADGLLSWPHGLALPAYIGYGAVAGALVFRRGTAGLVGLGLLFPWLLFFTEFVTIRVQEPFVLYRSYLWMAGAPAALALPARYLTVHRLVAGCAVVTLVFAVATRDRLATFSSEVALWDDAVRKNTDHSLAFVDRGYTSRGAALLRAGRTDEALADLDRASQLNPRSAYTYVNRAMALARKGERGQALADFDRAISLSPRFPEAHSERCLLLIRMEEPARALESCNEALRLAPNLPAALLNRSVLHLRAGRADEALADVERVLKFEPASGIALYNRGRIYLALGRAAEARRDLSTSCAAGLKAACVAQR